ncbi:hypothetical protein Tco_0205437 [Tanacetum coccineum]
MSTPNNNHSQMHNDIMAAGSKDHSSMLATGRYAQWQSCFMRYVDTKPNMKELKKCIFNSPYVMTRVIVLAKAATKTDPAVPKHNVQETYNQLKRMLQGESLNKQDVKTNLFWEFGKFTSRDGESIESYYSRFYKMMKEMNQAQRDKDMQNSITLIAKYFTKIYKPTNNNLRNSSNSRNKNVDSKPRNVNDRQTGQFRNQRTVIVVGAREIVDDTDEELDEQELEAHYMYMEKIKEVLPVIDDNSGPTYDTEPLEQNVDDNDENECVELANLIANLKLDDI